MQLKADSREKSLESEMNQSKNKATELERILKKNRNNEKTLKEELVKAKNQVNLQKQTLDKQVYKLQKENADLSETLSWKMNELNNKIGQLTRENEQFVSQLSTNEEELLAIKTQNESLQQRLDEFKTLKSELEKEKNDHQNAAMKVKELEYEVGSFGDWKNLSRASQSRMNNMSDMEKEVQRLRTSSKNLHDSLGNKLLLEEQVHNLEERLKRHEMSSDELVGVKVKVEALERELKDWKQLGVDYCQKGDACNPINVRSYIDSLHHRDLLLVSERSSVSSEKSTIQNQFSELKNVSGASLMTHVPALLTNCS